MPEKSRRKSIFRSIFVPLFLIMVLQAIIFYVAAMYGGIEESLSRNAADILSQRLTNRKNEIETLFNNKWANLDDCADALDQIYLETEIWHGDMPFSDPKTQIAFLDNAVNVLIDTLRRNEVNGVFLILNDQAGEQSLLPGQKYGLCIRDMDQESGYSGREDLLLERAPSSLIDGIECSLDSWWEPKYTFSSEAEGDYYYLPLAAALKNPGADSDDLAYCSGAHNISGYDPAVIAYSVPLIASDGHPYGVLGVELTVRYLSSLLPSKELSDPDTSCYVLAMRTAGESACAPIVGTGAMYSRCFETGAAIDTSAAAKTGGFTVTGRGETKLYGHVMPISVYNTNNPFEDRQLVLLAMVESKTLFAYIDYIKLMLMTVALICLALGIISITYVSRRFASPITALAKRVRGMSGESGFHLGRVNISEIDLLVDAIEELNRDVSKNSARTEFFSRMSHDMRTPMNAIISFSSPELTEGADEATKDDYLNKIHASGEYLLSLINEVLDMTKIESDKMEIHPENTQACRLFDAVVPVIEELARRKDIAFSRNITVSPEAYVIVDRQHLSQIVMNLLSNAVKFTPAGGAVSLFCDCLPDEKDAARALCRVIVADTGVGMSEEFVKNLYKPFEQEAGAQGGTGLGLSIAKKLVDLMGGDIACVSRKDIGTTFTVSLPLARGEAPEKAESALGATESERAALRGKRVLICEDNAINTLIICKLLEKYGMVTVSAANGREGVERFAASAPGTFDCVLMDIRMPVMDGLEAARALRALERPDADVPIIAMTANAFEQDERASRDAGMNAHLAKPVEPVKLFETLIELIK